MPRIERIPNEPAWRKWLRTRASIPGHGQRARRAAEALAEIDRLRARLRELERAQQAARGEAAHRKKLGAERIEAEERCGRMFKKYVQKCLEVDKLKLELEHQEDWCREKHG